MILDDKENELKIFPESVSLISTQESHGQLSRRSYLFNT